MRMVQVLVALGLWLGFSVGSHARGICSVPGTHPTIQQAVDDASCSTVELADETYEESLEVSRPVEITASGVNAVLTGRLLVKASLRMNGVRIRTSCGQPLVQTEGGAQFVTDLLEVEYDGTLVCPQLMLPIFSDGFESGDVGAWSAGSRGPVPVGDT